MIFTSSAFLLFLVALLAVYAITPQKYRWFVLLTGSMTFYGFAGSYFLLYINATIIITYFCTMRIKKLNDLRALQITQADGREAKRAIRADFKIKTKKWMVLCLVLILGILAVVKYADFVIANANNITGIFGFRERFGLLGLALPMGISFYTFQTVGYVMDVYREKTNIETNPLKLALFVSFFPQVVQGPISRFGELSKDLYSGNNINRHDLSRGAQRILWGFFKKLVIADRLWPALATLTGSPYEFTGAYYLLSIGLYAVILFCDFTGGIDITIGIAEIFGIKLPENFNRPFYSRSIQEYWQRWHMTMYTWFRDYVFYPFSTGKKMLRFSKFSRRVFGENFGKRLPIHISLVWVWFLTGLWHGATWNFIVWGLANGIVIMISLELAPLYEIFHKKFPKLNKNYFYRGFQIFRTFWLMNMIRSFDIYPSVSTTFRMMLGIITDFGATEFLNYGVSGLGLPILDYFAAGAGLLFVFWVSWLGRGDIDYRERMDNWNWVLRYSVIGVMLFMVIILGAYGMGYDARQFIYNIF
ncbi:MAG: MBOAT family protein [Defluviitaleaceae bacterium]|nr:MBOAT family protein [Defluviitaleaceae bacterium]